MTDAPVTRDLARCAAIVGAAEYPARRFSEVPAANSLEQAADLALLALDDAGLTLADVDGLSVRGIYVTDQFLPATLAEYLGVRIGYGGAPDLGGAAAAGMVWRAAAAIERGVASAIVCVYPGNYPPAPPPGDRQQRSFGASSYLPGSPQAEFEIPYGHLGQNIPYAFIAQRYAHAHGYDPEALARLVVHQRRSANANPHAIFHGEPLTEADVLASRMIADPLRMLEIVRPIRGGTAVVVASPEVARRTRHRPVAISGYGEGIAHKSPQFARDILDPPLREAAATAFAMAGLTPGDMAGAQIYDCYTIAVLMALEAAGFCAPGAGFGFLRGHDMSFAGDFPLNTNGGQLGYGQAGGAGGMTHVIEGYRQAAGRAGARQIAGCDTMFVSGNGGIMSEQVALVLQGATA
ncbi:thiolase family protein [Sphingomonas solaris]|uniref:Thiolase family protein n=1 Tax=Alterirhizorhabdus solaris TaxID=2529389 RepID=A0A558RBM7_9SPHN|nr:thiolase family protein [Sphingomonas solaris]TVV76760.1 thiolase family protein [Sphingomonas solaris]